MFSSIFLGSFARAFIQYYFPLLKPVSQKPQPLIYKLFPLYLLTVLCQILLSQAPASAQSSSACARDPKCVQLLAKELPKSVTAPTGTGYGSSTLTTGGGLSIKAVAPVAIVSVGVGGGAWYYWNESQNQKAQELAQQKFYATYCTDPSQNSLCGSSLRALFYSPKHRTELVYHIGQGTPHKAFKIQRCIHDYGDGRGPVDLGVFVFTPLYWGQTAFDSCGGPDVDPKSLQIWVSNPVWKDWPDADRETAVGLLSDSD
jgi:hypothetical protein